MTHSTARSLKFFVALAITGNLAACGGGGGSSPAAAPAPAATPAPPPVLLSAEGVYGGTLTGSSSKAFQMLVLESGDVYAIYGTQTATAMSVAGFIQGTSTSNNGTLTSADAKDFGFSPAVATPTTAKFDGTAKTISGTSTSSTGSVAFSGGPIAGSLYNYNAQASLPTVAGTWSLTGITGERTTVNIAATGAFSASSSLGCNFTGTVTPRPSGKNVFNVTLSFGPAPCGLPGQTGTGIAIAYPLANGQTQLIVLAADSTRAYGQASFGVR